MRYFPPRWRIIFVAVIRVGVFLFLSCPFLLRAQSSDTLRTLQLEETVVTATRSDRNLGALPLPVTLVSSAQIKTMGSLRLTDVLNEQTGLVSVPQINGIGNGLQLQGFDPDYTLILIDGEPLIGRTTGSLDLNRIAVGNIKQVEIVKGPSSSLYGSDALAGVVNIITQRPEGVQGSVFGRYGTNNTMDLNGDFGLRQNKLSLYLFGNRYSTSGYNLSSDPYSQTVSPFQNATFNGRIGYKLLPTTDLSISGRYYKEHQQNRYVVDSILSAGTGTVSDWNLNPVLVHRIANKVKVTARVYNTAYQTVSELHRQDNGSSISSDNFRQTFLRPEINLQYFAGEKSTVTAGAGTVHETVKTDRYGDDNKRTQDTRYMFGQYEWNPIERLNFIAGARFDHNSIYGSQLSPKFSSRWVINSFLTVKGSVGVGFKAPDFRQLYLNFTNAAAGGYSVFGTEVAPGKLAQMDSQGLIAAYYFDPSLLGQLKAERSTSYNLGVKATWLPRFTTDLNFFRNNVDGLIETQVVAVTTAGQSIYSYRNLNHVYTQGLEANANYSVGSFTFSAGYQLLYAKDKAKLAAIDAGDVFRRDPVTLESYRIKPSEYYGLYNRSRNMGNFKVFYRAPKGYDASVRVIYRGKYGIGSTFGNITGGNAFTSGNNGNDILDVYDRFVPGYAQVNVSVARTFAERFRLQFGIDNVFNYTYPAAIPNLPGRLLYTTVRYTFFNQQTNSQNP